MTGTNRSQFPVKASLKHRYLCPRHQGTVKGVAAPPKEDCVPLIPAKRVASLISVENLTLKSASLDEISSQNPAATRAAKELTMLQQIHMTQLEIQLISQFNMPLNAV